MNNHSYEPDILLVYKMTALYFISLLGLEVLKELPTASSVLGSSFRISKSPSVFGYTAYIPTKNQRYRRYVLTGLALVYSLTGLNQFMAPKQYVLLLMMMR